MEKIIKIGEQEVKLDNNMAWAMEYRDQFGKDIVPVIMPLIATIIETTAVVVSESDKNGLSVKSVADAIQGRAMEVLLPLYQVEFVDIVINITWAMAKVADDSIDPPKKWIRQFDSFPIDVIGPEVLNLVTKGSISSKNLKRLKGLEESLRKLQPLHSTTLSSPALNEG